jgi:uncharacterized coiled-coil DUF342 family protein
MATYELLKQIEQFAEKLKDYAQDVNNLCDQLEELHEMSWKDVRIAEINNMGLPCDDNHPHFDEYQAILQSNHETYGEFIEEFKNGSR